MQGSHQPSALPHLHLCPTCQLEGGSQSLPAVSCRPLSAPCHHCLPPLPAVTPTLRLPSLQRHLVSPVRHLRIWLLPITQLILKQPPPPPPPPPAYTCCDLEHRLEPLTANTAQHHCMPSLPAVTPASPGVTCASLQTAPAARHPAHTPAGPAPPLEHTPHGGTPQKTLL